jgi:hypothetical protein
VIDALLAWEIEICATNAPLFYGFHVLFL